MQKTVVELFAGVGGFRVGLEKLSNEGIYWETLLANQWEPNKSNQFAFECYEKHFGNTKSNNLNVDVSTLKLSDIPKHTLLVGGFPCQDYSVATTKSKGIEGKKGVLWWQIYRIVKGKRPPFVLLENVDRLLKSPANQRGRDFAIMLKCLNEIGYNVEWKVINAAEFGHSQKRRRVFIFAYRRSVAKQVKLSNKLIHRESNFDTADYFLKKESFFNNAFPSSINIKKEKFIQTISLKDSIELNYKNDFSEDLKYISNNFNYSFQSSGVMLKGEILTFDAVPLKADNYVKLSKILQNQNIGKAYFLNLDQQKRMKKAKAGKQINRTAKNGHKYKYREGCMSYPENINSPGRTMLTSEGTINRSTHVVKDDKTGKIRFITPIEAERLNGFPDNWTIGMTDRQRFFCMGNALVTGIITDIGRELYHRIDSSN